MSGFTVTRIRTSPEGYDDNGDPIAGTLSTLEITGCAIAPRTSSEPDERGRNGVIVGWTVYAPLGTDLVSTDLIEFGGERFKIEGEPGVWQNPWRPSHGGVEVALERANG